MRSLLFLLGFAGPVLAAEIQVTAHFADVPGGVEVPLTPEKLATAKGTTLLSSPQIIVEENVAGQIEITQDTPVPGGGSVPLGVRLEVKTSITEKGNIWFSGNLSDRSRGGGQKTEKLETAGFATREWYFSGYTPNDAIVLVRTTPASARVEKDGKTVTTLRELVVYLKFKKLGVKPAVVATKAAPTKTAPPTAKTAKKTTVSTKARNRVAD